MPRLDIRRVLLPKRGSVPRECEDWIAVSADGRTFTVADGATEGIDSRRWARIVTRAFVSEMAHHAINDERAACARTLGERLQARWIGREVPWYLEEKAAAGAFAAIVGVTLGDDGAWDAVAIGDCCLFVEHGDALLATFPAQASSEFNSHPTLLPSHHARYAPFDTAMRSTCGTWGPGGRLLLLSDAIAAWYLGQRERGEPGVAALHAAIDAPDRMDAVARLVDAERTARTMRNDDVAVLRVDWPAR